MGLFGNSKLRGDSEFVQLVMPNIPANATVDKKVIINTANMVVPQWLKIIGECSKLVNETENPKVFFQRYDTLYEYCGLMAKLEKYYAFKPPLPSQQFERIINQKTATINSFIDRYFESVCMKVVQLKTENAKNKKIEEFYDILTFYSEKMDTDNIVKFSEMYSRFKLETYAGDIK